MAAVNSVNVVLGVLGAMGAMGVLGVMGVMGVVKYYNDSKGFGMLTPDGEIEDIFVHFSAINTPPTGPKTLKEGQRVLFNVDTGTKGKQASGVSVIQ